MCVYSFCYSLRGENLNYKNATKGLLRTISNHHILGSLTSLGLVFGHVCSLEGCFNLLESRPYLESHMTRTLDSLYVTLIKTMPLDKGAVSQNLLKFSH